MKATKLSILNLDFRNPEERVQYREEQNAVMAARKQKIVSELRRDGRLDESGHLIFTDPLPDDMAPDSPADFKH